VAAGPQPLSADVPFTTLLASTTVVTAHSDRLLRPPSGADTLAQPRRPVLVPADTHVRLRPFSGR